METNMTMPNNTLPEGYLVNGGEVSRHLWEHIRLVAPTNYNVIIYGETGTGKEAIARLIHEKSNRKNRPFITINCGNFSNDLIARELFGHEKGVFADALQAKEGAFEQAKGGTIFLNGIGKLSHDVQVSLLHILQEKSVRRVGGVTALPIDVRIIVASSDNLYENALYKNFREDLYHRLNEFTLNVPALRERYTDLPFFVNDFLREASNELEKDFAGISDSVWDLLLAYKWPGNIRELKNVIRRACLLTPSGETISPKALPMELLDIKNINCIHPFLTGQQEEQRNESNPNNLEESTSLKDAAILGEQKRIMEVLHQVKFNKTKAAEILNIDRKTLYNKLRSMQLLK